MSKKEEILRNNWSSSVLDGCINFFELALELKEEGRDGWEWPYVLGLLLERISAHIRDGKSSSLTKEQTQKLVRTYLMTINGFNIARNTYTNEMGIDMNVAEVQEMAEAFMKLWRACPVRVGMKDPDVVITLPRNTDENKVKRLVNKMEEFLGDSSVCVMVGEYESTKVQCKVGSSEKYDEIIDDVLHGHVQIKKKPTDQEHT